MRFQSYAHFCLYEILHPKYVNIFTCSNIVLSITILLLIGTWPLNAITLDFSEYLHSKPFYSVMKSI
jgi:hypothetical protein